ncbi:MAG TPA: hypothetical protein VKZ18_22835 [Polyangia bacterium]|nr:hypothetical protein [Polyangia bacterium]
MSDASPRFRRDLTVSPTEADGVACVDVSDPKTGSTFRLYDFEYQLALQLNGQPVGAVTDWALRTYGADLTADGIGEFATRLRELGFLEGGPPFAASVPAAASRPGVPTAATGPEDSTDNAADEWNSPQGAKTATFVPDAAMLDSGPEPTPVAPLNLAELDAASGPHTEVAPSPIVPEATAPAVVELANDALISEPTSAPNSAPAAGVPPTKPPAPQPKSSWAADLDGALQSADSPAAVKPPVPPASDVSLPPALAVNAAAPPPGRSERRQPPGPEAVVMSGFSEDGKRGKAKPAGAGRTVAVVVVLLLVAAAAVGYWVMTHRQKTATAPQALRVRVVSPAPAAVYRWFSGRGEVTDYETTTIAFANPGRLAELLPAGTEVAAGDVVGKLQGASGLETLLAHDRSRVGFYKQLRDSMRAAGNGPELRQAELHLAEKQKLVDLAVGGLAKFTVTASEPGEVVETLAKVGMPVAAGAPVARIKGRLLHGAFALGAEERAALAKLDFCRIEVIGLGPRAANDLPRGEAPKGSMAGAETAADSSPAEAQAGPRFLDCKSPGPLANGTADGAARGGGKIEIPLPGDVGLVSGQPLRLARRRYDAVFPVPAAALVTDGEGQAVWIAGRDGTAERRAVTVAQGGEHPSSEQHRQDVGQDAGEDVLVTDGLHVGDQVVVEPPAELRAGARLDVAR